MSQSDVRREGSPTAPSLDTLVAYFVAAKKSLSATSHVYQANEIVEDARKLVEDGAVLRAKIIYVRQGVDEQVNVLQNIHGGLEAVGLEAQVDFQAVIKSLDVSHDRLQATLASLRKTMVSSTLSSGRSSDTEADKPGQTEGKEREEDKTLYDFIDESTHTTLLDSLRATIDLYNDDQAALHKVRTSLGDSRENITSTLVEIDSMRAQGHRDDAAEPAIPDLFHSLNSHATEMASLLQSLISHYDLCITALKHTEGGGEAARAATTATPSSPDPLLPTGADSPTEASLYAGAGKEAHREPISAVEREEMLAVLTQDAGQVDDVVLEMRERATEMRASLAQLTAHTDLARQRFAALRALLADSLAPLAAELLPACAAAAATFRADWEVRRDTLVAKTDALAELARFYDSFAASYASLLREVERRRLVEAKMEKVAARAMKEIEALRAEDKDMRSQFVRDVGEWLPRDIWPGLMDGAARWVVQKEQARGLGIEADEGLVGEVEDN